MVRRFDDQKIRDWESRLARFGSSGLTVGRFCQKRLDQQVPLFHRHEHVATIDEMGQLVDPHTRYGGEEYVNRQARPRTGSGIPTSGRCVET